MSSSTLRRGGEPAPLPRHPATSDRARSSESALRLPTPDVFLHKLGPIMRRPRVPPNPSPSGPHAPSQSPSTSSGPRRRPLPCRHGRNADAPMGEARDWAALPLDAISSILGKLGHIEILMRTGDVCRSWRHVARDDPLLWRRIDMRGHADLKRQVDLYGMARAAIRHAKGQCEAFWAEYAANDSVIRLLGEEAPSLKSLRLISCQDIVEFEKEIKKFPLLEELEISHFTNIGDRHVFEAVGKACPKLKHFGLNRYRFYNLKDTEESEGDDSEFKFSVDDEPLGIASMRGLCSLQLFGNIFTNKGLTAILDKCTQLEFLDIRHCFNVIVDDTLRAKCARIKPLKLPNDSTDDYQYPVVSPIWSPSLILDSDDYGDGCDYCGPDYILDSDDYDDYCNPFRYLDGVYELNPEDHMFIMGMRIAEG